MVTQYDIDCSQDLRSLSLKTTCQTRVFICLFYAGSICTAYTRFISCLPYSRPSIKQPGLRSIKQPGLRSIKQPGLRSIKQPGLRSIKQPGLRSTLVNCWCKADILPGGWTHIHLRPDWATVEAAKCASSTRHNISLYQLNMGDTNYLILLEIATIPVRSMFRGRDVAPLTRADLHTHQDYTTPLVIGGCNA